ncbi:hypothetical protein GE09DRAFT_1059002 [Coniochaeta sp. 2T2.1]|nr:hypothetical protein GE09DRAFT_1059002 [Coniochaeta sp. 2T2.1]
MAAPIPDHQQWSVGPPPPSPHSDLPAFFYRVQHYDSTSYQYADGEFESTCHYRRFNRYLNRKALVKHLNWNNRSRTPFISVFNNRESTEDAMDRAQMHLNWNHRNVRVCKIDTKPLQLDRVRCRQGMPVWATDPSLRGCFFFSTQEARRYLGLPPDWGQRSEWFAVNCIPGGMVSVDTFWDWNGQMYTRPDGITGGWSGDAQAGNSRPAKPMYW